MSSLTFPSVPSQYRLLIGLSQAKDSNSKQLLPALYEEARQKRPVNLLNQSEAASILQEHGDLAQLIHDYFMDEPCDDSDDELSEEEETPEQMDTESAVNSDCDERDHDAPLIHVEGEIGGASCFTDNEAVNSHPTLAQAAAFRWRCKRIKTAVEAGLEPDQRRGYISQFTAED